MRPSNRIGHFACLLTCLVLLSSGCVTRWPGEPRPIVCLSLRQAQKAIVDESFEPYFSQLQRREIETLTGKRVTGSTLEQCRDEARSRFRAGMISFTPEERKAVTWAAQQIRERLRKDYPLFAAQPWRFIKSDNHLCGGWSYTRGRCIILSQRTLQRIVKQRRELDDAEALRKIAPLLIHEQMHVLQRLRPQRFAPLYTEVFGLLQGDVRGHDWITTHQISNPDGIRNEWIIALPSAENPERYFWRRTTLKETDDIPGMGRDFKEVVAELRRDGAHFEVMEEDGKPVLREQSETVSHFDDRFPSKHGVDHPNEISAYLFQTLVLNDFLKDPEPDRPEPIHPISARFKAWSQQWL